MLCEDRDEIVTSVQLSEKEKELLALIEKEPANSPISKVFDFVRSQFSGSLAHQNKNLAKLVYKFY